MTSAQRGDNSTAKRRFRNTRRVTTWNMCGKGMNAFAKRWRLAQLAQPGTYELVEVRTRRGMTRALLFPKAIVRAELDAEAPIREAIRIKRERLAAKRAAKYRKT